MEITSFDTIPISIPKKTALQTGGTTNSTSGSDTFEHVLVRIETEAGIVGYGEVAPHPDWPNSGTQSTIQTVLDEEFRPLVEGRNVLHIGRIIETLDDAVSSHPFALSGVDTALYDAIGKYKQCPVYSLLGGPTTPERTLPLHYTIGIKDPETVRNEVSSAVENGFTDFKLKVGATDREMDCRRLEVIRDECPEARIRVDANQTWAPGEAVQAIRTLDDAADGILFVEQPVAHDDRDGLRRVRAAVDPEIMADEGCYSPSDVAQLARSDAVDAVNIKLAKAGGITNATRVASVAGAHGLPCFIGGMLELGVGASAASHFAVATPERSYPTGILNADASDSLLTNGDRWQSDSPTFTVPAENGLGITVDTDCLERHRTD